MYQIQGDATLVGTTELRTVLPKLKKGLKTAKIIIMNRGQPIAVLEDFKQHEEKEELLDGLEDLIAGLMAKERHEKGGKYLSHKELLKKLGE